jgi:type IV pilus assembly protein PilW
MNLKYTHSKPQHMLTFKLQTKQTGLSLIELMVAMTISLFLLIAIGLVYSTSKSGFTYANNTVRMSEDASFALDSISRDVRMASYGGCKGVSRKPVVPGTYNINTDTLIPNLDQVKVNTFSGDEKPNPFSASVFNALDAVRGFTNSSGANAAFSPAPSFLNGTSSSFAISTTRPILFVSGGSERALQVNAPVVPGAGLTTSIDFAGDPNKWNNNFTGANSGNKYFMLISDCKNSEIFRADSMTTTGTMTTESKLLQSYGADAVVTPLVSSTYFLATRKSSGVLASTPSLYRSYFNGNKQKTEELVPNVEAITFQYGENTSCVTPSAAACTTLNPPSLVADVYRQAVNVNDWSRVVSVRIGLIMVTEDNGQAAKTSATTEKIKWIDGDYPVPTADRRLRRAYSTTVTIRNRSAL